MVESGIGLGLDTFKLDRGNAESVEGGASPKSLFFWEEREPVTVKSDQHGLLHCRPPLGEEQSRVRLGPRRGVLTRVYPGGWVTGVAGREWGQSRSSEGKDLVALSCSGRWSAGEDRGVTHTLPPLSARE